MDIAGFIKDTFNEKYGKYWQCIIGNFSHSVHYKPNHYIYFIWGDEHILLFKGPEKSWDLIVWFIHVWNKNVTFFVNFTMMFENNLKIHYFVHSSYHILGRLIKMSDSLSIGFTFKMSIFLVTWKLRNLFLYHQFIDSPFYPPKSTLISFSIRFATPQILLV